MNSPPVRIAKMLKPQQSFRLEATETEMATKTEMKALAKALQAAAVCQRESTTALNSPTL